jgi:hypothetical protein
MLIRFDEENPLLCVELEESYLLGSWNYTSTVSTAGCHYLTCKTNVDPSRAITEVRYVAMIYACSPVRYTHLTSYWILSGFAGMQIE